MFFAVYVCRVDTSLLQGNFNSLVYLFFLSLVNSYLYFSFFYRFRNTGFINCNRIHSSNLHSNSVSGSFSFFIHCNNSTKLVISLVVINRSISTFNHIVTIQFHFFTSDTTTVCYCILYSTVTHRQSLYFFQSLTPVGNSSIQNSLSQSYEISVFSNEVGFAFQSDDSSKFAILFCQHTTFRCFTVRTFCSNSLSFFTDNFHCFIDIAVCFSQGVLAIHHTSSTNLTKLGYFSHSYSHNIPLFFNC